MAQMAKKTITLNDEKPISWNKFYAGVHWTKRKMEVERVHWLVRSELNGDERMFDGPVKITVTAHFKSKQLRLDASNICAKLYEDALIGHLIEDDNPDHVVSMTTISKLDRSNPRVEILIEAIQ